MHFCALQLSMPVKITSVTYANRERNYGIFIDFLYLRLGMQTLCLEMFFSQINSEYVLCLFENNLSCI